METFRILWLFGLLDIYNFLQQTDYLTLIGEWTRESRQCRYCSFTVGVYFDDLYFLLEERISQEILISLTTFLDYAVRG